MMDENRSGSRITRRKFLWGMSIAVPSIGLFALNGRSLGNLALAQTATPAPAALGCVMSPSMTEGPYFVDELLKRVDIRTDPADNSVKPGVPLKLELKVFSVNGSTCAPLKGAQVDIWHCDAAGLYSDEAANNTVGKKFLRGYQVSDDQGVVNFLTVYPGWYRGRTVHIHMKVRTFDASGKQNYAFNTQLFFDESITDKVYALAPYTAHGKRDTLNKTDNIFMAKPDANIDADDVGSVMMLPLSQEAEGYVSKFSVGVDLTKPSTESSFGPGGPGGQPPAGGAPRGGPGQRPPAGPTR